MKNGTPMHTYYMAWLQDAASHERGPNLRDAFKAGWNGRQDADNRAREIGYHRCTPFPVDPKVFFDIETRDDMKPGRFVTMDTAPQVTVTFPTPEGGATNWPSVEIMRRYMRKGFEIKAKEPPERRGTKTIHSEVSMSVRPGARLFIRPDDELEWTEIKEVESLTPPVKFAFMDPNFGRADVKKTESALMLDVLKDRYERNPGGYGGGGCVRHIFRPEDFLGSNIFHKDFVGCVRLKFNDAWRRIKARANLGTVTLHGVPETSINVEWSMDTTHEEKGRKFGALFNTNDRDKIFKLARSVQLTMEPRHFHVMHISILL